MNYFPNVKTVRPYPTIIDTSMSFRREADELLAHEAKEALQRLEERSKVIGIDLNDPNWKDKFLQVPPNDEEKEREVL